MSGKVLKRNGQIVYLSSYRPLNAEERQHPQHLLEQTQFDQEITKKLGSPLTLEELESIDPQALTPTHAHYYSDGDLEETDKTSLAPDQVPDADTEVTPEDYNQYVHAEVCLPQDDRYQQATVKRRVRGPDGQSMGKANPNPICTTPGDA